MVSKAPQILADLGCSCVWGKIPQDTTQDTTKTPPRHHGMAYEGGVGKRMENNNKLYIKEIDDYAREWRCIKIMQVED